MGESEATTPAPRSALTATPSWDWIVGIILAVIAAVAFVSCQKQQTEDEKNAEIERKVQERLAAERQTEQQQQLDQRQVDLDAREKALTEKQNVQPVTPSERAEPEESGTRMESRARTREPRMPAGVAILSPFRARVRRRD